MRTPEALLAEGECDEMVLGQLAVLSEIRKRLSIGLSQNPVLREDVRDLIDEYAEEIYDDAS